MKLTQYLILFLLPFSLFAQDPMEYHGEWQNNKRHGQGKMTYYDGSSYDGNWLNNLRHGQGTMVFSNGENYTGNWVNNQLEGTGAYAFKNGEKYEGQFAAGLPHGTGTFTLKSGDVYQGEMTRGEISGQGSMNFANGNKGNGNFVNGKMDGSGTMNYVSGDVYDGSWSNNQREGYGVQNFANGDVYEGGWKNDKMFGIGVMNKANGEKYVGEFNKEYEGMGKLTTANGDYIEGDFNNGVVDGNATIWYANGEQYQGEVKKGQPDGNGTYYYNDGSYYKGELKKGKPDGMGRLIAANGDMIKGGKWSKGGLKKTYEQIDASRKAFAQGMQALAQGMAEAGAQMQAHDAQMKAQVAANNAKWDNYLRESKQNQNTYNQLYQEELNKMNSNPYSKNNPMKDMEARMAASKRMQQMKQSQSSFGTSTTTTTQTNPSFNGINTTSYQNSPNHSSGNSTTQVAAQRETRTTNSETTLIKKYYTDKPHQLQAEYWVKNDKNGDVIEPHIEHGFYQSWYKNGKKRLECYFTNGEYDGEYKFWNENGQIKEFCTHKSPDYSSACIEIYWGWKNGQLESISFSNLHSGGSSAINEISYYAKRGVYEYHDKLRTMEYFAQSGKVKSYEDDDIKFYDEEHSAGIKSEVYYYKNKCVWYIQRNDKGDLDFISSYYIYGNGNYRPEPEYDWGAIYYDKDRKESKDIKDQEKYNNALRLKKMISEVSTKNINDIKSIIKQYLPMMDVNRYNQ